MQAYETLKEIIDMGHRKEVADKLFKLEDELDDLYKELTQADEVIEEQKEEINELYSQQGL
uniref:hypothetical protein n=1 Tax=Aerococcus urinaeequi TaxID=51665 RepID=UPI003529FEB8